VRRKEAEKEKTAEKTKKSKKNGENGEKIASGRWTPCAIRVYLKDVPFAESLSLAMFEARLARSRRRKEIDAKTEKRDAATA